MSLRGRSKGKKGTMDSVMCINIQIYSCDITDDQYELILDLIPEVKMQLQRLNNAVLCCG